MAWPGASRRETNHLEWEKNFPKDAIKKKGRMAQQKAIEKAKAEKPAKPAPQRQRNNRREY